VVILEFVILGFILVLLGLTLYDFTHPYIQEDDPLVSWTCDNCGYHVEAMTIEGVVEGMRIHETSFECPLFDDDI